MQVAQKRGLQDGTCVFGLKKSEWPVRLEPGAAYVLNYALIYYACKV